MYKTWLTSLLLAGAMVACQPALAEPGLTDTEILIGDVEPLTGPPALLGVGHTLGVKVAIAEANAAGGINGRKIRYTVEDDGYVTARTLQGLKKVIDVDKAFAMLGLSGSGQSSRCGSRPARTCSWSASPTRTASAPW